MNSSEQCSKYSASLPHSKMTRYHISTVYPKNNTNKEYSFWTELCAHTYNSIHMNFVGGGDLAGGPKQSNFRAAQKKRPHESVDYIQHRLPKQKICSSEELRPQTDPIIIERHGIYPRPAESSATFSPGVQFLASLVERSTKTDSNSVKYTSYTIQVQQKTITWKIQRRYRDFVDFRLKLRRLGFLQIAKLPPKTWTKQNFDANFLAKRQEALAVWISDVLSYFNKESSGDMVCFQRDKGSTSDQYVKLCQCIRTFFIDKDLQKCDTSAECIGSSPLSKSKASDADEITAGKTSSPISAVTLTSFELLKVLGKGSYGKVILVRKNSGHDIGSLYAMKVLKKEHVMKKKQVAHTKTERSVLGTIRHPFIVRLHYAFQTGDKLHFVLDYCSGGELFFHLQKHGRFPPKLALFYTAELTLALGELHSHGIVYRDMKPENILLDDLGHVQLADFGLSKEGIKSGEKGTRSFCGTPEYLAPEVLERKGHGFAVDWWALGALLYEMITGLPPWYSRDRQKMFACIRGAPLQFPGYVVGDLKALISDFLVRDPMSRLGGRGRDVCEVREHPIFRFVNWDTLLRRETKPPWKPPVAGPFKNSYDISNFEDSFTNLPVQSLGSSVTNEPSRIDRAQSATNGAFEGFTYVGESVLLGDNFREKLNINKSSAPKN
jgi:serine/threonine protein kinase